MYLYLLSVNPQTNVENQHFIFRHTKQKTDDVDEVRVELKALAVTYSFHDLDAEVKPQLCRGDDGSGRGCVVDAASHLYPSAGRARRAQHRLARCHHLKAGASRFRSNGFSFTTVIGFT